MSRILERIRDRAAPEHRNAFRMSAGKISLDLSGIPANNHSDLRRLIAEDNLGEEQVVDLNLDPDLDLGELHRALVRDGYPIRGLVQEGDEFFAVLDGSATQDQLNSLPAKARSFRGVSRALKEAKLELIAIESERVGVEAAAGLTPDGTFSNELVELEARRSEAIATIVRIRKSTTSKPSTG